MKLLILVISIALNAVAQSGEGSLPTLSAAQETKLQLSAVGIGVPIRCDENGNIYARLMPSGFVGSLPPITKITSKGNVSTVFDLAVVPNLPDRSSIRDFTVTQNGEVVLLVQAPRRTYVVELKTDGSFLRKTEIDKLGANKISKFKNGDILILGVEPGTPDSPHATRPYNSLFDQSGKFLKSIEFDSDKDLELAAERGDSDSAPNGPGTGNRAVSLGVVSTGQDGIVYAVRFTSPPSVYKISPSGVVEGKFTAGEAGQILIGFHVATGRAAVFLGNKPPQDRDGVLVVLDTNSGEELKRFRVPPALGAGLACFDGAKTLWFGANSEGKLSLMQANLP